jgi:hypothetical protein
MKIFSPISLLNCSFKMFSKILTLRMERVCQRLIAREHSCRSSFTTLPPAPLLEQPAEVR